MVSQVRLGAVLVGWTVSIALLLLMTVAVVSYLILGHADLSRTSSQSGFLQSFSFKFLVLILVFGAFFAGGYVSGRMSAYAGAVNGAMIVATSFVFIFMFTLFVTIVGNRMGINVGEQLLAVFGAHKFQAFIFTLFALIGSALGGQYGEGYVDRLDLALGVTKPSMNNPPPSAVSKQKEEKPREVKENKPGQVAAKKPNQKAKNGKKRQKKAS